MERRTEKRTVPFPSADRRIGQKTVPFSGAPARERPVFAGFMRIAETKLLAASIPECPSEERLGSRLFSDLDEVCREWPKSVCWSMPLSGDSSVDTEWYIHLKGRWLACLRRFCQYKCQAISTGRVPFE